MPLLRPLARFWTLCLGCTVLALLLAVCARLLAPLTPWAPAPALVAAEPPDGAANVLPRTPISLRFSAPMNRASVAAALRIDPPTPGSLSWSDDATALTFRPSAALAPSVTYTVALDTGALGRWWRPLEGPASVRFSTAPQPDVVVALPDAVGTPVDTSLAVVFSQPMVPPAATGAPAELPALQLTPPVSVTARWLDQHTLLLRPAAPLAPATQYTATIGAELTDLRGVPLGAPFTWSFTTAWPAVIERSPADGARWVSPRAPLVLRLDAPLDPALLGRALQITPPTEGDLAAATLGSTQVITFTPRGGWAFGTTYSVELVEPAGSGLGAPPASPWRFEVEPRPRLVALFPGQGQLLAPGQPVRLVFSTPMDAASLDAGLSIEPPAGEVPISVSETEVRLAPELRPSTVYTITIAPETRDRSGEPLGTPVQVRLRTAPARPALVAPGAFAGVVTLPVSATATVELESTNLTALDLELYQLDQPTLLLALALRPDERRQFSPERYGQPLARSWRIERSDPLDQPARLSLPIGLVDGDPLAPGAYFLRAVSPEGPRADLLVAVAAARLTLRQGPADALVWATDSLTGAPVPGLPIALYRDGAVLARGVTAAGGTLAQPVGREGGPLLAVAEVGGAALVRGDWLAPQVGAPPAAGLLAFPDRESYAPGEIVTITGIARPIAPEGGLTLPAPDATCRLQLRGGGGLQETPAAPCSVDPASGFVRGQLTIPQRLAPGGYMLGVQLGDLSTSVALRVEPAGEPGRAVELDVRETPGNLDVTVGAGGLPLASATVSWSLRLEPLAAPVAPEGFTLGPVAQSEASTATGQSITDAGGTFRVSLPDDGAAPARRYVLRVELADNPPATAAARGLIITRQPLVALGLPSRIVPSDRRSTVNLVALDGVGRPAPGARIDLQVFPAGGSGGPPLLARLARAGADGAASVQLVQLNPGTYEVVAQADGGPQTRETLWVYGGRYAGWRAPAGQVAVVADRDRYQPGDVATLLVASSAPAANLLLTVERGGLLQTQVRSLRAGQVITLPITADMAPGVSVGAVLAAGDSIRTGAVPLRVAGGAPPLSVTVAADMPDYLPSGTATLTITTSDGALPAAADLLVTLAPELGEGERGDPLAALRPAPPPPFAVATLPGAQTAAPGQPPRVAQPPGVTLELEEGAGAPGATVGRVTLPSEPGRWRITAYAAAGAGQVAAASTVVTTSRPLALALVSPPGISLGDRATVALSLRNTGSVTREVRVSVAATGLDLGASAEEQRLTLAPGAAGALRWDVTPRADSRRASLRVTVATPGLRQTLSRELPVVAPAPAVTRGETFVASGPLAADMSLGPDAAGELRVALAPGLRAALADQAAALAALPAPAVDDRAALTLIAAKLAEGAGPNERPRWEQLAREALDALDAAQNDDGGWGWWPGTPSEPFVTAFVVEAQAAARGEFRDVGPPSLRAAAYLGGVAPAADADTAAYIAYALISAGRAPATLPENLRAPAFLNAPLSADGLAFIALALPAQSAAALDLLSGLAVREAAAPGELAPVRWSADGRAGLPRSPTAVTAAAAQALAIRRPADTALPGAERGLLSAWGVDGWPSAYDAARVAAALLGGQSAAEPAPRELIVAGAPLLGGSSPISVTQRAALPVAGLGSQPTLSVRAEGAATYLVAYSVAAPAAAGAGALALDQELVDPASGAALDPSALRLGQLVGLRVTVVVQRPLLRADLVVAMPGGLEPLPATLRGPFLHSSVEGRRVVLGATNVARGVYTQTILARAVALGTFNAPPARIAAPYAPDAALAPAEISVTVAE